MLAKGNSTGQQLKEDNWYTILKSPSESHIYDLVRYGIILCIYLTKIIKVRFQSLFTEIYNLTTIDITLIDNIILELNWNCRIASTYVVFQINMIPILNFAQINLMYNVRNCKMGKNTTQ